MRVWGRVRIWAALALGAFLAACSGSGPTGRDLIAAGSHEQASFALIEITDQNVDAVSAWHRPSLAAVFDDPRKAETQRIGVGDAVQITIWEAGSGGVFSSPASDRLTPGSRASTIPEQGVAKDGSVNVPYAGRIRVAGKTPAEVESMIVTRLAGKATEPQALVTLTRNISHSATVTGDVTSGARVPLSAGGDRLLDVVATAGGVKAPVHEAFITLSRAGTTLTVPMQTVLSNHKENIYVRAGDVITVVRAPQSFTAAGATGRNAVVPFDASGITLEEAMGRAGGLLDWRADPTGVFVLRYESTALVRNYPGVAQHLLRGNVVPVAYHLNLRDPVALFRARRFAMRDKDILYVSNAPLTEVEKILRLLQTINAPVVTASSIERLAN